MPSYCFSSSDFLYSQYTVLLSGFLLSFWYLLMSFFTSMYFSDPSGSNLFFLSSLLLSYRSSISAVTQGLFSSDDVYQGSNWLFQSLLCWRWSLNPCLYLHCERCKLPAYHSLEGFQHIGIFQFSRSDLSDFPGLVCFGLLILFRRRWKNIISKSWSLPMSAPDKLRVLALFTPDRKRFLTN